jgi:hypothetical protein
MKRASCNGCHPNIAVKPISPIRATALASALSDFRGWTLYPHCARCRVLRQLPVNELANQVGGGTLLRDVLPKLRCQKCGDPPKAVKMSDGGGPSAREVWLIGGPHG